MNTKRNPAGWFEIYVQDMERAKKFYEKTFQVTLEHLESPEVELWAFPPVMQPNLPGCAGALVKMEGKKARAPAARSFISPAKTAVSKPHALRRMGAKFRKKKRPSDNMASSP